MDLIYRLNTCIDNDPTQNPPSEIPPVRQQPNLVNLFCETTISAHSQK